MFKRKLNKILLVVVGVLVVCGGYAQNDPALPTDNYSDLGATTDYTNNDSICPSISGTPSEYTFQVEINTSDVGDTYFEWVVYGGTIVYNNGSSPQANQADAPQSVGGVPYYYISNDNYSSGTYSQITIQWHTEEMTEDASAWVAVRQISEWGCYEGTWSVFTQDIFNEKPVITLPDNPDILLGYKQRENFVLPIPQYNDPDECPNSLVLTYTIDYPSGGTTSNTYNSGDASSYTVNLELGDNIVTWIASDGHKSDSAQFTITVDDPISINHIAWKNPSCDTNSDGELYIHDITASKNASNIFYQVNSEGWGTSNTFNNRSAGNDTLQMVVQYNNDTDWDESDELYADTTTALYKITLRSMADSVASPLPSQNDIADQNDDDPGLTVNFTNCVDSKDGSIVVDPLSPSNSSLSFNGSSHQMPLNLAYNSAMNVVAVAAWIKTTSNNGGPILSFDPDHYFQLRVTTGAGDCFARFQTADGEVTSNQPVNDGQWHLVVGIYDGTNGTISLFVDGYPTEGTTQGNGTIGGAETRYGYIGRRSNTANFGATTSGTYYSGQIADVAVFESLIDSTTIDGFLRDGFASYDHRWLLNHNPSSLSATDEFSDVLDLSGSNDSWARFIDATGHPARVTEDAPVLKQWDLAGSLPVLSLYDLDRGLYTLTVKDILGCGTSLQEEYEIQSGDESIPFLLTNSALFAPAVLSDTDGSNVASLANDGMLGTTGYAATPATVLEESWRVDLGATRTVHQVKIWFNTSRSDFRIALSQDGVNLNYILDDYNDTDISEYELTVNGTAGRNGRFLHVIDIAEPAEPLELAEVEVWTNQEPVVRNFYLGTNQCTYTINNVVDGSTDPIPWDACGGARTYYLDGATEILTINGLELELNTPDTINWLIEDNNPTPITNNKEITYELLDTIPPSFVDPLPESVAELTWCDAQDYSVEIPDYDDNYVCEGSVVIEKMELFKGTDLLNTLTYPDMDPEGNDSLTVAPSELTQGNHEFIWVITDEGGNIARDTQSVYVQTKPEVVNASVVNATCNGEENGQLIVWNIIKDDTETDVEYWLVQGTDTTKSPDYFIDEIPTGTYQLTINVNGCESDPYGGTVTIGEPPALTINETLYPPACFVDDDGVIEVSTTGGDIYNVLHFPGDDGPGLSVDYSALDDVTSEGTVECWVYLDTLSTDNENSDAAFITKGATSNDFALQMEDGVLTFNVTNDAAVTASVSLNDMDQRQWYHVAATWNSSGDVSLYVHDANGLINSTTSTSAFTGPAQATGTIRLGSHATDNTYDELHGFMRNARLWKRALSEDEIYMNMRLNSPIDPAFDCVANFPMTNTLINFSGAAISPVPSDYVWQDKAYWWEGYDYSIAWRDNLEDLSLGDYTIWAYDVFACSEVETIHLPLLDDEAPVFKFTNADNSTEEPYNDIHREAETGECSYTPTETTDLDPIVTDDNCGLEGSYWFESPDITNGNTLNGVEISGTVTVTWYATDGQNEVDTTVVYVVDDTQAPYFESDNSNVDLYLDDTGCTYTISGAGYDLIANDYCGVDYKVNNFTLTNTLDGATLGVGSRDIRWIAFDMAGNADTVYQTITVHDEIPPFENCTTYDAYLGADGTARLNAEDLYGSLSLADNCALQSVSIAVNVALNKFSDQTDDLAYTSGSPCEDDVAAYASKANDGILDSGFDDCSVSSTSSTSDPKWWVNLEEMYDIKRIVVHNTSDGTATNLTDFTIEISASSDFSSSHTIAYNGSQQPEYSFDIDVNSPQSGQYVRITSHSGDQLQMAEFEVYGVLAGASTENVADGKQARMIHSYVATTTPGNCEQNVPADRAVDGNREARMNFGPPCSVTHTQTEWGDQDVESGNQNDWEWWQVNLQGEYRIDNIVIYDRRYDGGIWDLESWNVDGKLLDFFILVADSENDFPSYDSFVDGATGDSDGVNNHPDSWWDANYPNVKYYYSAGPDYGGSPGTDPWDIAQELGFSGSEGQYVRIWKDHSADELCLAEVEVYGVRIDIPETNVTCDNLYASPVTAIITATDMSGNISQCDASINVNDEIAPTAVARNITASLDENGQAIIRATDINNGSYDNCGIDSMLVEGEEEYILDCSELDQELTLTFTVVDFAKNRNSVDFEVTVIDEEGPNLSCPDQGDVVPVYLDNNGELTLDRDYILNYILPGSEDNCGGEDGIITISSDIDYFDCDDLAIDVGNHDITIIAGDIYTNTDTCDLEIEVLDTIAPRVRAKNATLAVDGGEQPIPVDQIDNGSSDNCEIVNMWTVPSTYNSCYGDTLNIELFAEDASGNINSDEAEIIFEPSLRIYGFGLSECNPTSGGLFWVADYESGGVPVGELDFEWDAYSVGGNQDRRNVFCDCTEFDCEDGHSTSILEEPCYSPYKNISDYDMSVRLVITDTNSGCKDTLDREINFSPSQGGDMITQRYDFESEACLGETLPYVTYDTEADEHEWSFETTGVGSFVGQTDQQTVTIEWDGSFVGNYTTAIILCRSTTYQQGNKKCVTGTYHHITIYKTPDPGLQIIEINGVPTTENIDKNDDAVVIDEFEVCPDDTVVYEVTNLDDNYTWDWMPVTQGSVIEGGESNDPTMTVIWGSTLEAVDSIKLKAYSYNTACYDSVVSVDMRIRDTDPPVFTSQEVDFEIVSLPTNPGQCVAWLTNLPIPEAQDECNGKICNSTSCYNLTYSIDGFAYKQSDLFNTENLSVGTHTITWIATDNGGNSTDDSPGDNFEYTITVEDQQRPSFPSFPADTTLIAGDGACYMRFDEPTNDGCAANFLRQITADDNCTEPEDIEYRREILKYDVNTSDYTIPWDIVDYGEYADPGNTDSYFPTKGCLTAEGIGIDDIEFESGDYNIIYYARDENNNTREVSFYLDVVDESVPSVTDPGQAYFDNISVTAQAGQCNAVVDITKPAGFAWAEDNCTDSEDLTVTVTRSDGEPISWGDTSVPFPVGETTVTWYIDDEAGNSNEKVQVVTVTDDQAPDIDATTVEPAKLNYTWCEKGEIKLPVPDVSDNCNGLDSLRVNVNSTGTTSVSGVNLSPATLTIEEGNTYLLAAGIVPSNAANQAVGWSSSDNTVAGVNNGLVTGVSEGTATITVSTSEGGFIATCDVTVEASSMEPNLIQNGDFSNGQNDWTFLTQDGGAGNWSVTGGEANIDITNDGNAAYSVHLVQDGIAVTAGVDYYVSFDAYASENRPFVLDFTSGDDGYIGAPNSDWVNVFEQDVDITLTIQTYTYIFTAPIGDNSARFDFNVGAQGVNQVYFDNVELRQVDASSVVSATGVSINPTSASVGMGATKLLTASVEPASATNQAVSWNSDNTSVATVSQGGLVTAQSVGTANITVTTNDGNHTATCSVTVTAAGSVFFTQLFTDFPVVATQTDLLPITAEGTYSVQWVVWDRTLSSLSTPYDISVERQPRIIDWVVNETSCPGATDGSIEVSDISVTSGADVEYSIESVGSGYQSGSLFSNLGAGNYNYLHITANGCASPYKLVSLDQLPPYQITGNVTNNWCAEDNDGEISITTTGGAFSEDPNAGGSFSWHYDLDGDTPDNTYPNVNTLSGVNISSGTDGTSTISNLLSGQYYVYYTDATGSCNAGANFTVISEDNESPDVKPFPELPIVTYTDEDFCTHTVTSAEATVPDWGVTYDNTNLVPATRDDQGCSFDTEYKITNATGTSPTWLSDIEGQSLTHNVNQVMMQFQQNDNTYPEEYVYTIRVDDDQEPYILTQSISGALDENGKLPISAAALDNGSDDNCLGTLTYQVRKLESDPWADEVLFDCDDVDSEVSVFFKVTDASGNADSTEISGITITDEILPTVDIDVPFEYNYCATIRDTPSYIEDIGDFTLNTDDYSDNCSVNTNQTEYKVEHESTGGTITVTQDWTTGASGSEGNAAFLADGTDMPFYVGENRIYFKVTDQAGNPSAGTECFTIIVYPQPKPGEINE